jgi:hypothetical protein
LTAIPIDLSRPFIWSLESGLTFDSILIVTASHTFVDTNRLEKAIIDYRTKVNSEMR